MDQLALVLLALLKLSLLLLALLLLALLLLSLLLLAQPLPTLLTPDAGLTVDQNRELFSGSFFLGAFSGNFVSGNFFPVTGRGLGKVE